MAGAYNIDSLNERGGVLQAADRVPHLDNGQEWPGFSSLFPVKARLSYDMP